MIFKIFDVIGYEYGKENPMNFIETMRIKNYKIECLLLVIYSIKWTHSKHSGLIEPIPRTTESQTSVASQRILYGKNQYLLLIQEKIFFTL